MKIWAALTVLWALAASFAYSSVDVGPINQKATATSDGYLSAVDWVTFNASSGCGASPCPPATRTINTTAPLTGGGNLSADRTFAIPAATSLVNGYLTSTNWVTFNAKAAAGANTDVTSLGAVTKIFPAADSTTAISIDKADGTTVIATVDTTNKRLGIGSTAPATALDVVNANANVGGLLVRSNTNNASDTFGLKLTGANANDSALGFYNTNGAAHNYSLRGNSNGKFEFIDSTLGQTDMYFDTSGNTNFGTAGQFVVSSGGNITKLNNVTTTFPAAHGTAGQVLSDSDGAGTLTWVTRALNPLTTTGDIIYSSDNSGTAARLAVGGANTLLHGGTTPSYSAVTDADHTGQIGVTHGGTGVASVTTAPAATKFAGWDANSNLSANSHITGYATTATAAGTTTLTVASAQQQYFTGSTTQTVALPVTSTLVLGQQFTVVNNSSGAVTVQSSGLNNVQVLAANSQGVFTVILTSGTTAASWSTEYAVESAGTVTSVAATVPTFLSISGSPVTTTGTLAITLSGTALPVANGGTGLTAGTSGGVLAYTASGTLASSAALTANAVVVGGGAGVVPAVVTNNSTATNKFLTQSSSATPAWGTIAAGDLPGITQSAAGADTNAAQRLGTNTNDNASAGNIGEIIENDGTANVTGSTTLGTYTNITSASLTLTAGDWDIFGSAPLSLQTCVGVGATAAVGTLQIYDNTNSASRSIAISGFCNGTNINTIAQAVVYYRAAISGSTTYLLRFTAQANSGSPTITSLVADCSGNPCTFYARRRR